jgi:hypothetical protein
VPYAGLREKDGQFSSLQSIAAMADLGFLAPLLTRGYSGRGAMETAQELSLRENVRLALVEGMPGASDESVEKTLNRIMIAVDAFERAAANVLVRYEKTFADLAK